MRPVNRLAALAIVAAACSRPHGREGDAVAQVHASPRDAAPDATPAWITDAVARGGPGLCASIRDTSVLISRRDASGRLVETLALDAEHGKEPTERTTYVYDATGRLTHATRLGTTRHTFDETIDMFRDKAGRVVRKREHHADTSFLGGDVNVTYRWEGKPLAHVVGLVPPDFSPEDPTEPLAYALVFSGTVHEDHYHDGSPAPEPSDQYVKRFDERGRLVETRSIGFGNPSGGYTLEWDADDHLVTFTAGTSVVRYVWRDGHVIEEHHTDAGKDQFLDELRYDAAGRLVEYTRFAPAGTTRERITSSQLDRDSGVLVTTTVTEDASSPLWRQTYRYDCGPAATP